MKLWNLAPILGFLLTPAFAAVADFRTVLESPEERRAIVEVSTVATVTYRLCTDSRLLPLAGADNLVYCRRLGAVLALTDSIRGQVDRAFHEQLEIIIARERKGMTRSEINNDSILVGGFVGLLGYALAETYLKPGSRLFRASTGYGQIFTSVGTMAGTNVLLHHINRRYQADGQRLAAQLGDAASITTGPTHRWRSAPGVYQRRGLDLIAEALAKATKSVAGNTAVRK